MCEWLNPALCRCISVLPANDVPCLCDYLARSTLSRVPVIVEPCGTNKDSGVGASVDHTSVPCKGESGGCGCGGGDEGSRLIKQVIGKGAQMGFSFGM